MQTPDYDHIFSHHADRYDRLVMAEDHQRNLPALLDRLGILSGRLDVADLGSGTGRITFMIAPFAKQVYGVEPAEAMRQYAVQKAAAEGTGKVRFLSGEHKSIPLPDGSVDVVIEGWAFLRAFGVTHPAWRTEFEAIWKEVRRVLRGTGPVVLIETMGTFNLWEKVPERVGPLYEHFEKEMGLKRTVIRTDYRFGSPAEAAELGSFFFGEEIGAAIRARGECIVPEATAIWHGSLV